MLFRVLGDKRLRMTVTLLLLAALVMTGWAGADLGLAPGASAKLSGLASVDLRVHPLYWAILLLVVLPAEVGVVLGSWRRIRWREAGGLLAGVIPGVILGTYVLSSGYYDAYYLSAQKVRTLIRRDFEQAFADCDALLAPVTPTPASRGRRRLPGGGVSRSR